MHHQPIYKYMTVCPHTIGREQTLDVARRFMREHSIRHLPVLDAGALVGIVSDRDLEFVLSIAEVDPKHVLVEDAMTPEPYIVPPDAKLSRVAAEMAEHKYGSAIVVESGHVAGVFTTVDALRVLARMLEAEEPAPKSTRARA